MLYAILKNGCVVSTCSVEPSEEYLDENGFVAAKIDFTVSIGDRLEEIEGAYVLKARPPLTAEQLVARFTTAIQKRLDAFARSRHYDNILSACTYATSAVAKFQAEGQACVNLRDATWAAAYAVLEQVNSGQRPLPDDLADIEADLPALEWPQ